MPTDIQSSHDPLEKERLSKPLPPGMRYLTTDDYWQEGDEYDGLLGEPQPWNIQNGTPRWWKVGSRYTSIAAGDRVQAQFMCYTPRGLVKRKRVAS